MGNGHVTQSAARAESSHFRHFGQNNNNKKQPISWSFSVTMTSFVYRRFQSSLSHLSVLMLELFFFLKSIFLQLSGFPRKTLKKKIQSDSIESPTAPPDRFHVNRITGAGRYRGSYLFQDRRHGTTALGPVPLGGGPLENSRNSAIIEFLFRSHRFKVSKGRKSFQVQFWPTFIKKNPVKLSKLQYHQLKMETNARRRRRCCCCFFFTRIRKTTNQENQLKPRLFLSRSKWWDGTARHWVSRFVLKVPLNWFPYPHCFWKEKKIRTYPSFHARSILVRAGCRGLPRCYRVSRPFTGFHGSDVARVGSTVGNSISAFEFCPNWILIGKFRSKDEFHGRRKGFTIVSWLQKYTAVHVTESNESTRGIRRNQNNKFYDNLLPTEMTWRSMHRR